MIRSILGRTALMSVLCILIACSFGRAAEASPPQDFENALEFTGFHSGASLGGGETGWNVQLSAAQGSIRIPERTTVTATADRDLSDTGYRLYIEDDDSQQTYKECAGDGSGPTTCTITIGRGWEHNSDPRPINLRAQIRSRDNPSDLASNTANESVDIDPRYFSPQISFQEQTDPTVWRASASDGPASLEAGYSLAIENRSSGTVRACRDVQCESSVGTGTYRAVIVDTLGNVFGQSGWYTLDDDGVHRDTFAGVDLQALAETLGGVQALCVSVATAPRAWASWTTVNEAYFGCDASARLGLTTLQALRRIALLTGGASIITWLNATETNETTTLPSPRTPTDPDDSDSDDPRPLPVGPVDTGSSSPQQTDDFLARNSDRLSDVEDAELVRNRCIGRMRDAIERGVAGLSISSCDTRPIFFTSGDVAEISRHDLTAINYQPDWTALTFRPRKDSPYSEEWYNRFTPCTAVPRPDGKACHEFPYFSSVEGGYRRDDPKTQPRIDLLSSVLNSKQGRRYQSIRRCFRESAPTDRKFLVIASPSTQRTPTVALCNGKP